ncbi:MAG TPA: hypothetical protein VH207_16175 [Chthoniobacterales bacterium]|jgi:hypothetical protein|nr:hypothetical protein [Chthoniobacterales bacterium]
MSEQDSEPKKLRLAETPEEQKCWMAQWREAERALLEVKREELRALADEEAQAICDILLENADEFYVNPRMKTSSGRPSVPAFSPVPASLPRTSRAHCD